MREYIKREDAFDAIMAQFCASSDETEFALNNAIDAVREIPAANVVERKKGKWIDGDSRRVTAVCSVCGHLRLGNGADWCNRHGYFCEICGAKNGGDDDNQP